MAYSGKADYLNKRNQLGYEERLKYFREFKQALSACGEDDVEPVRKMLQSMGEKRDVFVNNRETPSHCEPLLESIKKNKVAVFKYLLQQGAYSEENSELITTFSMIQCIARSFNPEFVDCIASFGFDVSQHASKFVDEVLSTKEKKDENQNHKASNHIHLGWGDRDSEDEDSEELDSSDEEFQNYYDDENEECEFCPWYKKKMKEMEIISESLHKQQMQMIAKILQFVNPNEKSVHSNLNEHEKIQALFLHCKNHSDSQRLELFDLTTAFKLQMIEQIDTIRKGILLHKAVMNGNLEEVKSLVNSGADLNFKNSDGLNPAQAYYKGTGDEMKIQTKEFYDIFMYLLEKGLQVKDMVPFMVSYHKTYFDYKTGKVCKRGYETELNYIVLHREICLLYGNRFDMVYEEFFYDLSLPLLCTLMQAGYDMGTLFSAICLKGLSTDTQVVFDLAFWAHPWIFKKLKPDYDSVIEDIQVFRAAKKRPIYSYFTKRQTEVPSLLQLSVFCIRQHVQTVMNAKDGCNSFYKCSISILPRILKLKSRLSEKLVHLLSLRQFYVERDPQKRTGRSSFDRRTPAQRQMQDNSTETWNRLSEYMHHMSGPPPICHCDEGPGGDTLHMGIYY